VTEGWQVRASSLRRGLAVSCATSWIWQWQSVEADIKEFAIGIDVFGRASDFDPKSDPIVRVQDGGEGRSDSYRDAQGTLHSQVPPHGFQSRVSTGRGHSGVAETSYGFTRAPLSSTHRLSYAGCSRRRIGVGVGGGQPVRTVRPLAGNFAVSLTTGQRCRRFPPDGKLRAYVSHRASDGKEHICLQQMSGGEIVRLTRMASNRH
jgi:hypothetical protein